MFWYGTSILLVLTLALWLRWRRNLFSVFIDLGIPGPKPSIFFGNLMELIKKGPVVCQNDWIKKYGDVFGYYYGAWPTLVVTNTDLLKKIFFKEFPNFTDRPTDFFAAECDRLDQSISQHVINMKGKKWKEMRSIISAAFTSGKLRQMTPLLTERVNLMVSELENASENGTKDVEMYSLYKGLTMDAISKVALGLEPSIQDNPNNPHTPIDKLLLRLDLSSVVNVLLVSFREFKAIFQPLGQLILILSNKGPNPMDEMGRKLARIVKARKKNPRARRNDLLQALIDARADKGEISDASLVATPDISDNETRKCVLTRSNLHISFVKHGRLPKNQIKLTDDQVVANTFRFFIAEYETTSTALAFITHHLVNNIPVQDKIREEIYELFGNDDKLDYDELMKMQEADRVISEVLRLNPPVYSFIMRVASENFELERWTIPAGMTVQVPVYNLHYSNEHFHDPTTFDPNRFLPRNHGKDHPVTWLPFGAGPRNCIGMRFALLEIKMALATMLRRFKLIPCGKTETGKVSLHFSPTIASPVKGIHLRAVPIQRDGFRFFLSRKTNCIVRRNLNFL